MIGWVILLVLLALLLIMKAGVRLLWESGSAQLKVRIGFLRFSLSANEKKKPTRNSERKNKSNQSKKNPSLNKWIRALVHHWRNVLDLVVTVLRMPKLDLFRLHVTIGGKDPEVCAMNYGRVCAGLSGFLPVLQQMIPIKKQDVQVACGFAQQENDIMAEIETTVRVYEILGLLCGSLGLIVKLYRHTKSLERAVQV